MKYDELWTAIRTQDAEVSLHADRQIWHNRRTVPTGIEQRGGAKFHRLLDGDEMTRRRASVSRTEADRILQQIISEERQRSTLAAGVNLQRLEPQSAELRRRLNDYIAARRHDVRLSFPRALDHVDANGMIALAQYKLMLRPVIESAPVAELERRILQAYARKMATDFAEAELIEERIGRGGLSRTADDLPIIKRLNDYIEGNQDLRVEPDAEIGNVQETIAKAERAISLAQVAQVQPIDGEHAANDTAKQAYQVEVGEFEAEQAAGR